MPQGDTTPQTMEEHRFVAQCLKVGLRLEDLKELELKDVVKILICYTEEPKTTNVRKATQEDIDRFF